MAGELHRDERDTTDPVGPKLRRGVDAVEKTLDDRFPARGRANQRDGEYRPLDEVSRGGKQTEYRGRPTWR